MTAVTVPDLKSGAISDAAIMLLGFQRTKQIRRASRLAHMAGDSSALEAEVRARREQIFRGALAEIYREYVPLRNILKENGIAPKRVIDIGCGQAINDAFLAADFGCAFTLVDIETTDAQYHGWSDKGSGYASLADAKAFLVENGTSSRRIRTINPRKKPEAIADLKGDMVTSLFSCGFHYPIDEYLDLFCRTVEEGGCVVLDFRELYLRRPPRPVRALFAAGKPQLIEAHEKSRRLLIRKAE